ncbi:MAG: hypothetical protein IPK35_07065 [Saprospiraceae bacterium]|nr:hypothetical protein [Saprospiraceae bacterium]
MIIYFRNTFSVWYILTISLLASCYRMPQNEVNHQMVKDSLYYTNPITLGILSDPQMDEISGIVVILTNNRHPDQNHHLHLSGWPS